MYLHSGESDKEISISVSVSVSVGHDQYTCIYSVGSSLYRFVNHIGTLAEGTCLTLFLF